MEINKAKDLIKTSEKLAENDFTQVDEIALKNQKKVLDAFRKNRISYMHFSQSEGYGYDDAGRETLCRLFADVFGAEDCIVSPLIANGTHALTLSLFGILRPNDAILSITGKPYDTLDDVINGSGIGSLKDYKISYNQVDLHENGDFDIENIDIALKLKPKLVFIQRSKGYAWREALSVHRIGEIISHIKAVYPESIVMVDNCYGEFVEEVEPTDLGADIIAGSLIKNPGGGIAPTGGYIAGKKLYIEQIAYRLTSPGIGMEVGSYSFGYRTYYQGLFLAPSTVKNAVKGNILCGYVFDKLGFDTMPKPDTLPKDIIRSIKFDTAQQLVDFCQKIQRSSPIDGHVTPQPWDMPGYNHQVIMAAGTFVQGASLELTADGAVRPPYVAYLQGGLTYEHVKLALEELLFGL
ncbi:MAG TPA: methionine gamma-lyase family protein [Clostridia bacterium]|jgi:cystathionine beta-lyase family protein involved in aluminum resistance|nr:methionine gamma-lyase family protein [Clostridia bacterium]